MGKAQANEQSKCCDTNDIGGNTDPSCACSLEGCDCGVEVKRKTVNIVICLVVLLAVVGILVYKLTFPHAGDKDANAFTFTQFTLETTQTDTEAD